MNKEEIAELIKAVSASDLTKFEFEEGNVKISMEKTSKEVVVSGDIPKVICEAKEETVAVKEAEPSGNIVKSPLVGMFYASPAEGEDPFVCVGDTVKKGQTLAIVEAMKLMNEIESEFDGTVEEVYVENGQAVEYGQPLFRIG